MLSFDKDFKSLGFVLALCVLAEPGRRRQKAERERKRQQEIAEREEQAQARREAQERARKERASRPPSASTPPQKSARRFPDSAYEHYEKHGYWRGSGGGSWTSSKHPDDWEHMHLK